MIRRIALAAAVTAAVALSGCVSLFPKSEAVTLYKLSIPSTLTPPVTTGPTIGVLLGPLAFTRAAASDRILTTKGAETAFVGGARWVAPAPILFQEALSTAFDQTPGMNLSTRGEAVSTDLVLRVEVRTFEAQYSGLGPLTAEGKKGKQPELGAPTAVVEVHVTLMDLKEKAEVSNMTFREEKPAADNRVSAIVNAYDDATASVIHDIVGWTAGLAKAPPKAPAR